MAFDRTTLEERERCPLCSSPERSTQYVLDGFHIVNCQKCAFKYVVEVANEAANSAYYETGYAGERHRQGQDVNASINIDMLRALGDLKGKKLLDIGSGFGFLLARARDELGMIVCGAELSVAERSWAKNNLNVDSYASTDTIPDDEQFDVITLFEVIEHVRDPLAIYSTVDRLLARDGHLLIGTDNFENSVVRGMGDGFPKWIPNQHISLFSPSSLEHSGVTAGVFKPVKRMSYTPWEYYARLAVIRMSGGAKGKKRFALDDELSSEDDRGYKFFPVRKAVNSSFARFTRSKTLNGAMMYLTFQKV